MRTVAAALCGLLAAGPAPAAARTLGFSTGSYDALRGTESSLLGAEFAAKPLPLRVFGRRLGRAAWIGGGLVTGRMSGYLYMGGRLALPLGKSFALVPSFAPGVYFAGRGKDLGGALEFRSGLEIEFLLPGGDSLGAGLFHVSNGALYGENPGAEVVAGVYRFALARLW